MRRARSARPLRRTGLGSARPLKTPSVRPGPTDAADTLVLLRDAVLVGSYLYDAGRAQRAFSAAVRASFGLVIEA